MRVRHAFGDTPMAEAARIHEATGRGVRQCCEQHARADVEQAVEEARKVVAPLVARELEVERVDAETMNLVLR